LLSLLPSTVNEEMLQFGLSECVQELNRLRKRVDEQQSALVLQNIFCREVRSQLAAQEEDKKEKRKGKLSDGVPKCLTSDAFYERVVEHERQQRAKLREKE
ncbi:hypothetical protein SCHPADRAFT_800339, partial [Schizopora paradoxa]